MWSAFLVFFLLWVFGVLLLNFSAQSRNRQQHGCLDDGPELPGITIFSVPQPFSSNGSGLVEAAQELAVRSWLALSPEISVVLFARDPSVLAFAAKLEPRVSVESAIDFTFLGTPFFHSMVARSQTTPGISVFVDPQTILLPDFFSTLCVANNLKNDWVMISKSKYISYFPYHLENDEKQWLQDDGEKIDFKKLQEFASHKQEHGIDAEELLIAWNAGDQPLYAGVLPPFLYGKGLHNEWLINEVLSSDFRFVFDASEVISSFYPESLRKRHAETVTAFSNDNARIWELRGNCHHAILYGSLCCKPMIFSSHIAKLTRSSEAYTFINPENEMYTLGALDAYHHLKPTRTENYGVLQFKGKGELITSVGANDLNGQQKSSLKELCKDPTKNSTKFLLPYSLNSLLQLVADKNKSVVLAVAGYNYKEMLMSWICRLRQLEVANFIVCALDPEIYRFSVLQGLPVFKDPFPPNEISFNDCHFGTKCFQKVTKVKSRIVLQILKMGYNVLLSDVDVYWFHNPLPVLYSYGSATLVAQSDEYNETEPINLPRRLNSGFYFVRSNLPTIAAMDKVVKHASSSDLSEQPSFYDVLCGEGGIYRVGNDQCREPSTNLTVQFLDRNFFPNGAYRGLWDKHDVQYACQKQGCLILHNNWIRGRKRKLDRQVRSRLWEYDAGSRMCIQIWQRTKRP